MTRRMATTTTPATEQGGDSLLLLLGESMEANDEKKKKKQKHLSQPTAEIPQHSFFRFFLLCVCAFVGFVVFLVISSQENRNNNDQQQQSKTDVHFLLEELSRFKPKHPAASSSSLLLRHNSGGTAGETKQRTEESQRQVVLQQQDVSELLLLLEDGAGESMEMDEQEQEENNQRKQQRSMLSARHSESTAASEGNNDIGRNETIHVPPPRSDNISSDGDSGIPPLLLFTHTTNLLDRNRADPNSAARYTPNILRTIQLYQQEFSQRGKSKLDVRVLFLDNHACIQLLNHVYPSLVPYLVQKEHYGPFVGDVCRTAALYHYGGYYFDVDLQVMTTTTAAIIDSPHIRFATVLMLDAATDFPPAFFQAFLASVPRHEILYRTLQIMEQYYIHQTNNNTKSRMDVDPSITNIVQRIQTYGLLGPLALRAAYEQYEDDGSTLLWAEELLDTLQFTRNLFWDVPHQRGVGCCCNYVVHNGTHSLFFSRMVGAGPYCDYPSTNKKNNNTLQNALPTSVWEQVRDIPLLPENDPK